MGVYAQPDLRLPWCDNKNKKLLCFFPKCPSYHEILTLQMCYMLIYHSYVCVLDINCMIIFLLFSKKNIYIMTLPGQSLLPAPINPCTA